MNDCQCKSGFFALRDCGQPAVAQCEACSRAMCHAHAAVESRFTQCRDCWAKANQSADPAQRAGTYAAAWSQSYPSLYYAAAWAQSYLFFFNDTATTEIYTGTHYHHYYDQYDTRSFRQQAGEIEDGSDDARAGFGDS